MMTLWFLLDEEILIFLFFCWWRNNWWPSGKYLVYPEIYLSPLHMNQERLRTVWRF